MQRFFGAAAAFVGAATLAEGLLVVAPPCTTLRPPAVEPPLTRLYGGRPKRRPRETALDVEERRAVEEWRRRHPAPAKDTKRDDARRDHAKTKSSTPAKKAKNRATLKATISQKTTTTTTAKIKTTTKKTTQNKKQNHLPDDDPPPEDDDARLLPPRLKRRVDFDTLNPARFVGSFGGGSDAPPEHSALPEVAFMGRSNVGKSSMLNAVIGARKPVAVVGQRPGRTRRINCFDVSDARGTCCRFVDLPGYGFARLAKKEQDAIARFVENYLDTRRQLRLVVLIVDSRRGVPGVDASDDASYAEAREDGALLDVLRSKGRRVLVVATKIDKLPNSGMLVDTLDALTEFHELDEAEGPLYFSSVTRQGRAELWSAINDALVADPSGDDDDDDAPSAMTMTDEEEDDLDANDDEDDRALVEDARARGREEDDDDLVLAF